MSTIVTRAGKGSALTNAEVDANFTNLNAGKLESSSYTAADVLAKLLTVDGNGSGLDADKVRGVLTDQNATASTIPIRSAGGYIYATYFNQSSSSTENPAIGAFFVENNIADGFHRKASLATVRTALGGSGNGLNADKVDSFDASASVIANTVAARDNIGNLFANQFVTTVGAVDFAISNVVCDDGSGYLTKIPLANFWNRANIGQVVGWTPTMTTTAGAISAATALGTYAKIGPNLYWVAIDYIITNAGTAAGSSVSTISLPFTAGNQLGGVQMLVGRECGVTGYTVAGVILPNFANFSVQKYDNAAMPVNTNYRYCFTGLITT